jgi:hypothetical protein
MSIGADITKARSVVDGTTTTLKCGVPEFESEDKEAFDKHMHEEAGHYDNGYAPCMICGQPFHFTVDHKVETKHVKRGIAMHPECKQAFFKEIST